MWIVSRVDKDGLKNRMRERLCDLGQSIISRHAVRVSCIAPNALRYSLFDAGL